MSKLKTPIDLETAFSNYLLTEQLGEGGAGRVYGGVDSTGAAVAVKVLTSESKDKRRRFKNEIAFLSRDRHKNIVTVTDHGVAAGGVVKGPFYVMARYGGSLRDVLKRKPSPDHAMALFSQVIDGVEAAHLLDVTHRDLKPENVLIDPTNGAAAVSDFGVASFTADQMLTLVETAPTTRLANFQYAAPEQRVSGGAVGPTADIYALGLMLNELFTESVPYGTDYQLISSTASDYAFLDAIVATMIRQNPGDRPQSIAKVKTLIQMHRAEAVSLQKLRELDKVVVPVGQVTDPLAFQPPKLIAAEYNAGILRLELDRPVNENWIRALQNMGSYSSPMGAPPHMFRFTGVDVTVVIPDHIAQSAIDHFKVWLTKATTVLKYMLEQEAKQQEEQRRIQLRSEREAEQRRLEVNRALRI